MPTMGEHMGTLSPAGERHCGTRSSAAIIVAWIAAGTMARCRECRDMHEVHACFCSCTERTYLVQTFRLVNDLHRGTCTGEDKVLP